MATTTRLKRRLATNPRRPTNKKQNRLDLFFCNLGPGLITGCADDDPSGISTYAVAGAAFGYALLWTSLLSLPLMASIQLMCGRRLAVINGALAPPLILLAILLTSNRKVMGARVNPPVLRLFGWSTFAVMSLATMAMIVSAVSGQG
jgi:Mn2+/Fe2+ NRAMP family transporter